MQLTFKKPIEQQVREAKFDKCYFCGKEEPKGVLTWFSGGNLFECNPLAHLECYINALKEKYGFNDTGYRKIDENMIEIFSQTTGWERLSLNTEFTVRKSIVLSNQLFSHIVIIYNKGKHLGTYGITKQTADFLVKECNAQYVKTDMEVV